MKTTRAHGYILIEVVAAIVLLGMVLAGVYAGVHVNERMVTYYVSQGQALDVLDNVVERSAARQPVSMDVCRRILEEEMAHSPLGRSARVTATCATVPGKGIVCTIQHGQRRLAIVRMGDHE